VQTFSEAEVRIKAMYLRTPEVWSLAGPSVTNPCANPPKPPITNGGQFIQESAADKVLAIISGPSLYQKYIQQVLAQGSPKLPKKFFRIVTSLDEVPAHLRGRFVKVDGKVVGGTIDRAAGTIYILPPPGRKSDTRLEFALHEAVHILAHPFMTLVEDLTFHGRYGTSCIVDPSVGTFQRKYCFGLGEGATQVITEHIMNCQGISRSSEQPYKQFIPPVLKLIEIFSLDRFARAYFWGAVKEFTEAMESRWGGEWRTVSTLTTDGKPQKALDHIAKLEAAYFKRRGPKGDYPTLPRFRSYA
jgi:hypothetical protein